MMKIDLNQLREELRRLAVLSDGWNDPNEISALERDLALAKLRELYDMLLFAETGVSAETATEVFEPLNINLDEVLLAVTPVVEEQPGVVEVPQPAVETPEPAAMPEPEAVTPPEPLETPEPEVPAAEPEKEKPAAAPELAKPYEPVLFGMDELTQHKRKQRVIMSLYGEAAADPQTPKAEEKPVAEPLPNPMPAVESPQPLVAEQPVPEAEAEEEYETELEIISLTQTAEPEPGAVLGEVINRGVQTLGETLAQSRSTVSEAAHLSPIDDLRAAIGINDRFLLVRDLFEGNAAACDTLIEKLNSFDDLDDCLIYLAEHYTWNPNSDGAKLLVELLERKLS